MQAWIIISMNRFGYIGIALMIAIQNILPFIPSEIILTFGGFMTAQSNMNIWLAALFATIGSVSGAAHTILHWTIDDTKPFRMADE